MLFSLSESTLHYYRVRVSNRISAGSEHGASSKVQILEAPRLSPGDCVMCGASRTDDRDYVDIGLTVDFVGVIYFCTICMTEVANRLGCLMPEQTKKLEDELDAAQMRILEFETKDQAFNDAIGTIRNLGLFGPSNERPSDSVLRTKGTEISDAISTGFSTGIAKAIVGPSDQSEQSDSEQGSDDVSSTTDYDFGQFL